MKIGIIGSNGFIGSNLNLYLSNTKKFKVFCFSSFNKYKADWIKKISNEIKKHKPDVIINCATDQNSKDDEKAIRDLFNSNLKANILFMNQAIKNNNFKGYISFGTKWEFNEHGKFDPLNFYAATKHANDIFLKYFSLKNDIVTVSLKIFETYGKFDKRNRILNLLLKNYEQQKILNISPGNQFLDYVHILEICDLIGLICNDILKNKLKLSTGKYAWLIGNDDLILPNTLNELKKIFESNIDVDYFFVNSYYLNSSFLKNYSKPFNTTELKNVNLKSISKFKENKKVNFWEVIDPDVSWEFLISIFLCIFNRKMWLNGLDCLSQKDIEDTRVWSNFDNTCFNGKVISTVFKDKKSFICAQPLSVNFIGEREWVSMYDFVEIIRIPELLDYYRSQGMSFWKYVYCKNYALRNFFNFFTKILINGEGSGKQYVNLYKHFFKNLIYPYSWLSIIFFVIRSIKKVLWFK